MCNLEVVLDSTSCITRPYSEPTFGPACSDPTWTVHPEFSVLRFRESCTRPLQCWLRGPVEPTTPKDGGERIGVAAEGRRPSERDAKQSRESPTVASWADVRDR